MKNKLLISGTISDTEVDALNIEFKNDEYEIVRYVGNGAAISGIHDIVNIIFNDLSLRTFTRDYLVAKALDYSYAKIRQVVVRLQNQKKIVNCVTAMQTYQKKDGSRIFIEFYAEESKFEILIDQLNAKMSSDFFESIQSGKNVFITLDKNEDLQIQVF